MPSRTVWRIGWLGLALAACSARTAERGPADADSLAETDSSLDESSEAETGTGRGTSGTGTSETDTSDTDTSDTDLGETESTETGEAPTVCGDGVLGPDERCDDGNRLSGDDCSADCRHPLRTCGSKVFVCGNTLDDDLDGLIDLDDPDCLDPCDDEERYFTVELPTQNDDKQDTDCWWDDNEGSGDDLCDWDYRCDLLSPAAPLYPHDPQVMGCLPPSPACVDACLPLTPNGCDCNGCCVIAGQATFLGIWVSEYQTGCSHADFPACNPCTIETSCFNPCEPDGCELCFPAGIDALAPGCDTPTCPAGVDPCVDPYECADDERCSGGCCLPRAVG